MTDLNLLRSDLAITAYRHIAGEMGGSNVYCVVLADGFIIECGSAMYAQERADLLADAINAFGARRFAFGWIAEGGQP